MSLRIEKGGGEGKINTLAGNIVNMLLLGVVKDGASNASTLLSSHEPANNYMLIFIFHSSFFYTESMKKVSSPRIL